MLATNSADHKLVMCMEYCNTPDFPTTNLGLQLHDTAAGSYASCEVSLKTFSSAVTSLVISDLFQGPVLDWDLRTAMNEPALRVGLIAFKRTRPEHTAQENWGIATLLPNPCIDDITAASACLNRHRDGSVDVPNKIVDASAYGDSLPCIDMKSDMSAH
jgi:hypothetical protein